MARSTRNPEHIAVMNQQFGDPLEQIADPHRSGEREMEIVHEKHEDSSGRARLCGPQAG